MTVVWALSMTPSATLHAERHYLSAGKLALISGASAAILGGAQLLGKIDTSRASLIPDPLPGDRWIQRHLGGSWHVGKTNFLDKSLGSALTPAIAATSLFLVDMKWPQFKSTKDIGQDLALFVSGLLFTEGVTNLAKTVTARPRPYLTSEPKLAAGRTSIDPDEDRRSFFSGHMSSSMFSAVYLNKRIRHTMKDRMSAAGYHHWRWAPPSLLFSWTTFVGWSRIHAYKHYFSDVVVAAVVGGAIGEFFFRMGDSELARKLSLNASPTSLQISVRF
ncbi:MAG: phosphatase PAP2 family protein [candidate division Zixibacteria bacterium]|nr:phosphatase PAP2 family protein [candidate division Zixibacteria bacterium]